MCVDVIEAVSVRVKLGFVADAVAVFVKVGESVLVTELDEVLYIRIPAEHHVAV